MNTLDNVGSRRSGPTLLISVRSDADGVEAEPVLLERRGPNVVLTLDDASELSFDLVELHTTLAGMTAPVVLRAA